MEARVNRAALKAGPGKFARSKPESNFLRLFWQRSVVNNCVALAQFDRCICSLKRDTFLPADVLSRI